MNWRQVARDLQCARELLVTDGWCHGYGDHGGPRCAVHAMVDVNQESYPWLKEVFAAVIGVEAYGPTIGDWNDARTRRTVLAAFDAAASLALSEAEVAE